MTTPRRHRHRRPRARRRAAVATAVLTLVLSLVLAIAADRSGALDSGRAASVAAVSAQGLVPGITLDATTHRPTTAYGDTATTTVTLGNTRHERVTGGLTVATQLTPGLHLVSATPSAGTFDPRSGTWTIPGLDALQQAVLTLQTQVTTLVQDAVQRVQAALVQALSGLGGHVQLPALPPLPALPVLPAMPLIPSLPPIPSVPALPSAPAAPTVAPQVPVVPSVVPSVPVPALPTLPPVPSVTLPPVPTLPVAPPALPTPTLSPTQSPTGGVPGTAVLTPQVPAPAKCPENSSTACAPVVVGSPRLQLTRTANPAQARAGDTVGNTVTVTNIGDADSPAATVRNTIPTGSDLLSATPSQGHYDSPTGVWGIGRLAPGAAANLVLTFRAPQDASGGVLTGRSTFVVVPGDTPVVNGACSDDARAACASTRVDGASGPAVQRTEPSAAAAKPGDRFTYTLTARNDTSAPMTAAQVAENAPPGTTIVGSVASQGAYDPASGEWRIGNLAPGAQVTLQLTARQDAAAAAPTAARLQLLNVVDRCCIDVTGGDLVWTVTAVNTGAGAAPGVRVDSQVPLGTHFTSADATQGSYDPATGVWDVGTLEHGGGSARLTLHAAALPAAAAGSRITARAAFLAPPGDAPMILGACADDAAASCAVTTLGRAELSLSDTADHAVVRAGDTVTYTVRVAGEGVRSTTGVLVSHRLPQGLTPVDAKATQGTYDPASGLWKVGDLGPSDTATLTVTARVPDGLQAGDLVARAGVEGTYGTRVLSGQACADAPTQACASASLVTPRLQLAELVDTAQGTPGAEPVFTVSVVNLGAVAADGVRLKAALPDGTHFVRSQESQGMYDPAAGEWAVGTLPPDGGSAMLRYTVHVDVQQDGAVLTARSAAVGSVTAPVVLTPCADDAGTACAEFHVAGVAAPDAEASGRVAWPGNAAPMVPPPPAPEELRKAQGQAPVAPAAGKAQLPAAGAAAAAPAAPAPGSAPAGPAGQVAKAVPAVPVAPAQGSVPAANTAPAAPAAALAPAAPGNVPAAPGTDANVAPVAPAAAPVAAPSVGTDQGAAGPLQVPVTPAPADAPRAEPRVASGTHHAAATAPTHPAPPRAPLAAGVHQSARGLVATGAAVTGITAAGLALLGTGIALVCSVRRRRTRT